MIKLCSASNHNRQIISGRNNKHNGSFRIKDYMLTCTLKNWSFFENDYVCIGTYLSVKCTFVHCEMASDNKN
jgi:hypothetical protein